MLTQSDYSRVSASLPRGWAKKIAASTGLAEQSVRQAVRGDFANEAVEQCLLEMLRKQAERSDELRGLLDKVCPPGTAGGRLNPSRVTVAQAAGLMEIGEEQVRRHFREGRLKGVKRGRNIYFRLEDINKYLGA